jgi:hypothetical protein
MAYDRAQACIILLWMRHGTKRSPWREPLRTHHIPECSRLWKGIERENVVARVAFLFSSLQERGRCGAGPSYLAHETPRLWPSLSH